MPGNVGGGRPPDEIRAKLRELGAVKGTAFLSDVLEGKISYTLTGVCANCGHESAPKDTFWLKALADEIRASVDQRLKANEQALRYGLGTKDEVTAVSPDVQARVRQTVAIVSEMLAPDRAEAVLARLSEVWR